MSDFKLGILVKIIMGKNPESMINSPPIRCLYRDKIKLPKGISAVTKTKGDVLNELIPIIIQKTKTTTTTQSPT
jgi:hypothetical protein